MSLHYWIGVLIRRRLVPAVGDLNELVKQADGILKELKLANEKLKEPPDTDQLTGLSASLDRFKTNRVTLKEGVIDGEWWNKQTEDEKVKLHTEIWRLV